MFEYLKTKQVIEDMRNLVEEVDKFENNTDLYCELVRNFIINSYCEN